jgi:hypothetical protein
MQTQTIHQNQIKEPHYLQVQRKYDSLGQLLREEMSMTEQDYYNVEFLFGCNLLNDYFDSKLTGQTVNHYKQQLLNNPENLYWNFIKSYRRNQEWEFWAAYKEIYYYNRSELGQKIAARQLRSEWLMEMEAMIHYHDTHNALREHIKTTNIQL